MPIDKGDADYIKAINERFTAEKQLSGINWNGYIKGNKEASASMKNFLLDKTYVPPLPDVILFFQ